MSAPFSQRLDQIVHWNGRYGSSTSFQAEAGHFRFSPKTRHLAAAHRSAAKLLTRDEARRIAANIAK
jgi:hypothetical protein